MPMMNAAEEYRRQQVLNAPPEQLTLMLYNGCLKFIDEGTVAVKEKKYEQANTLLQKAQRIISEFRVTLNMEYEISHQLLPLYNYIYDRLIGRGEGNYYRTARRLGGGNEKGTYRTRTSKKEGVSYGRRRNGRG